VPEGPTPGEAPNGHKPLPDFNRWVQTNVVKQRQPGYVAVTGEILHLADAYEIPPDAPYQFNRRFDEETGYRAGSLTPLGRYNPFPGYLKVTAHLFLATDLTFGGQRLDEGEELEVAAMPFADVLAMVLRGECIDGSLQLGVLLAAQKGLAG